MPPLSLSRLFLFPADQLFRPFLPPPVIWHTQPSQLLTTPLCFSSWKLVSPRRTFLFSDNIINYYKHHADLHFLCMFQEDIEMFTFIIMHGTLWSSKVKFYIWMWGYKYLAVVMLDYSLSSNNSVLSLLFAISHWEQQEFQATESIGYFDLDRITSFLYASVSSSEKWGLKIVIYSIGLTWGLHANIHVRNLEE